MPNTNRTAAQSIAHTLTLTGSLLEALTYAGTERGEHALQNVLRMDLQRVRVGIPSLARSGAHELL